MDRHGTGGGTAPRRLVGPVIAMMAVTLATGCGTPDRTAGGWSGNGPTSPAAAPSGPAGTTPTTPSSGGPSHGYAFPVRTGNVSYHPTHAAYPGTDIFAACGSPVVAVTDGTILEVSLVDKFDERGPKGPFNGGKSVSLLGDDGVRYYGSHLSEVTAGVSAGVRVRAGQRVGSVGRTGNASNVCHLHFGISPPCGRTGDWWIRRGVVWPATYLDAWRRNAAQSPADKVVAWQRAHGCPKAPPG
jgi:murein DD-endopeptidase MepM/ murein hydrolase activator NlpD